MGENVFMLLSNVLDTNGEGIWVSDGIFPSDGVLGTVGNFLYETGRKHKFVCAAI